MTSAPTTSGWATSSTSDALDGVRAAPIHDLEDAVDLSRRKLVLALSRLEDGDAVDIVGDQVTARIDDRDEAVQSVEADQRRRKQVEASRLGMVSGYAGSRSCRRRFLVGYFGRGLRPRLR